MAVGDVYLLRDIQSYIGSQVLNVYFYRQTTAGSNPLPASQLAQIFQSGVVDVRCAIQANALLNVGIEVVNLGNLADYFLDNSVVPATGDIVSQGTPPFVALSYRAARLNPGQRYAYKRIGGLTETLVEGNTWNSSFNTAVNNLAAALGANLGAADGSDWEPVLVARPIVYGVTPVVQRTLEGSVWSAQGIRSQASRSASSPP